MHFLKGAEEFSGRKIILRNEVGATGHSQAEEKKGLALNLTYRNRKHLKKGHRLRYKHKLHKFVGETEETVTGV